MQPIARAASRATIAGKASEGTELSSVADAEACFHQSIKIAKEQQAKSWELRAVLSLSRLLQNQAREREARSLLQEIYDKFTEGFATVDLREAKALLAQLL